MDKGRREGGEGEETSFPSRMRGKKGKRREEEGRGFGLKPGGFRPGGGTEKKTRGKGNGFSNFIPQRREVKRSREEGGREKRNWEGVL